MKILQAIKGAASFLLFLRYVYTWYRRHVVDRKGCSSHYSNLDLSMQSCSDFVMLDFVISIRGTTVQKIDHQNSTYRHFERKQCKTKNNSERDTRQRYTALRCFARLIGRRKFEVSSSSLSSILFARITDRGQRIFCYHYDSTNQLFTNLTNP